MNKSKKQPVKLNEEKLTQLISETVAKALKKAGINENYGTTSPNYWKEEAWKVKEALQNLIKTMKADENFKTMNAQANNRYGQFLTKEYFNICKSIDQTVLTFTRISGNNIEQEKDEFGDDINQ